MAPTTAPRVSVGLPVRNGEDYLAQAVESILSQTFADFELVISDNASTDGTEDICRDYATRDQRIVYIRRASDIGGAGNFNAVFHASRGELFKWMAHDDVCRPGFLRRCVDALDGDPSLVAAYPSPVDIDAEGRVIGPRDQGLGLTAERPSDRFGALLFEEHAALAQFGVVRRSVLARTPLLQPYSGSDRPLLGELALHGPLQEVEEELFLHREHPERAVYVTGLSYGRLEWWDPQQVGRITLPAWRRIGSYLGAIRRVPLPADERVRCLAALARWARTPDCRKRLRKDLRVARGQLAGRGRGALRRPWSRGRAHR